MLLVLLRGENSRDISCAVVVRALIRCAINKYINAINIINIRDLRGGIMPTCFPDPRILHLPLINSVYQVLLIVFAYIYFVLVYGPRFMKDRPPYSLKTFIKLYNLVQITANVWLVCNVFGAGLLSRKLFCPVECDYTNSPTGMKVTTHAFSGKRTLFGKKCVPAVHKCGSERRRGARAFSFKRHV